jgi:HAD superfamily hydrolase (TIGR01509 family)
MTIRAVAWDVDGTLVDSEPLHHLALLEACRNWNVDISDIQEDAFRGAHMGDVWRAIALRMPAGASERDWMRANDEYYVKYRKILKPMPQAVETVSALARAGILQICVSNAGRIILDANIDALGIAAMMEFTLSLDDVTRGKPHPEPYATGCARLGFMPGQVVAVEDSAPGRQAARAAGLVVIAYDHLGERITDADYVIRDLSRLPSLIGAHRPATMPVELHGTGGV